MSASQHTRNLSLPQFEASDKPSWLGDINSAMLSIDNGYGNQAADITKANDAASNASAQSTANQVAIGQLNTEMESVTNRLASLEAGSGTEDLESRISSLENEQGTLDGRIETVEDDVSQHGTDIANLQSGQTTLSNTLSAAETNISNNQKAITAVETSVNNVSTSLRSTDSNVAKNATDITSLNTKTNTTNTNLNALTTRVSKLEGNDSTSFPMATIKGYASNNATLLTGVGVFAGNITDTIENKTLSNVFCSLVNTASSGGSTISFYELTNVPDTLYNSLSSSGYVNFIHNTGSQLQSIQYPVTYTKSQNKIKVSPTTSVNMGSTQNKIVYLLFS
ncbi:MAG: hypothetical protein NC311_10755 [Muribaculaceae bacterium]|nr:hypothetical protein [Muribaculaceae bacterium]